MTHIPEEQLALYVGGDLEGSDFRTAEEHLRECVECRVSLSEFQSSATALQIGLSEPTADDLRAVRQVLVRRLGQRKQAAGRWAWVMATAAAATIATVVLFNWKQSPLPTANSLATSTAFLRVPYQPLFEPSIPNLRVAVEPVRARPHRPAPGLRTVTLLAEGDGPPILRMTTSDPNVVILWQLDERTRTRD